MQCPHCHTALLMSNREGIEIDYCPQCRGVWLDRGELDKIIERSGAGQHSAPQYQHAAPQAPQQHYQQQHRDYDDDDDDYKKYDSHHGHHKRHKKESFLGDLFDF